MVFEYKQTSKTMSHAGTDDDSESETERALVTEDQQATAEWIIKTDLEEWDSCHSWDNAMKLNKQLFSGKLEINILNPIINPRDIENDMENDVLQKLLETIYIIRHRPRRQKKHYAQAGEISITRQMGSCCFMLPYEHKLLVPLMDALLGSQQLHTVVMHRGLADHQEGSLYNFDSDIRVQEIKPRSSPDDLASWSLFATESPEEAHTELFKTWGIMRNLRYKVLISSDPVLFGVATRNYETNILDHLSEIVEREVSRHSLGSFSERYRLARK
jgi:hypothetical protein